MSVVDFGTNGKEEKGNLPVVANTFRIAGVQGSTITVETDSAIADVNLGDKDVDIMKFKLKGDTSNDIEINQITIVDQEKNIDEDAEDFKLFHKGVQVAATAKSSGKYLTFTLSTPVKIESGKTEKFSVTADIIAGAGDKIELDIDQEIYVLGKDLKYGYGIAVTETFTADEVNILAGEVTLSETTLPSDKVRFDKDNVVLAAFDLISKAGKGLSLEDIAFVLNGSVGGMDVLFENVELELTVNGSTRAYSLDYAANTYSDTDMGISIPEGATVKARLIADMANQTTVSPFYGEDFFFTLDTTTAFEIIETEDDQVVTDITPSLITFDTVDVVNSSVTVSRLYLGDVDVVRGSSKIDAYKFEVKTDSVSSVLFNDITFNGDVTVACAGAAAGDLTKNVVTQFQLWKASNSGYSLVDSESASKLSAGSLTFTNLAQEIPASTTQQYLLTVDVAGSDDLDGCEFEIVRGSVDIDDDDSYPLTVAADLTVGRTIAIQGAGTLSIVPVTNATPFSSPQHIIGGTTSDYVAKFDVTANNEDINLIDVTVNVSGGATFNANVTEVILLNAAGTELARKGVTNSTTVEFTDLANVVATQGTTQLMVKLVTNGIGKGKGTEDTLDLTNLALTIVEARGKASGEKFGPLATTAYSNTFDVIPAKISNIEFVASYNGVNALTSFNSPAGQDDADLAILKITTDNWSNLTTAGTELDVVLDTINFTLPAGVTSGTLERLGNGTVTPITLAGGSAVFPTVDNNSSIDKSSTAYYVLRGNIASGTPGFSVKIDSLDG